MKRCSGRKQSKEKMKREEIRNVVSCISPCSSMKLLYSFTMSVEGRTHDLTPFMKIALGEKIDQKGFKSAHRARFDIALQKMSPLAKLVSSARRCFGNICKPKSESPNIAVACCSVVAAVGSARRLAVRSGSFGLFYKLQLFGRDDAQMIETFHTTREQQPAV